MDKDLVAWDVSTKPLPDDDGPGQIVPSTAIFLLLCAVIVYVVGHSRSRIIQRPHSVS